MDKENVIVVKSLDFAVEATKYAEELNRKGYSIVAKQLARSATSIGANIWEAQQAESRNDFVHKIKVALKEAGETCFWLELSRKITGENLGSHLIDRVEELTRIMSKIIASAKKNENGK